MRQTHTQLEIAQGAVDVRQLLHFPEQRLLRLGIFRLLPLVLLGKDDCNTLGVELFGVDPPQLLDRLVALLLETLRDLGSSTLILQGSQRVEKNIFAIYTKK
jgi:hypothetical protein